MPNYCNYEMKITGKEENVREFFDIITASYDYSKYLFSCNRHFWRVFEAVIDEEEYEDEDGYAIISGNCAWSVYSCMFDGVSTYQNRHKDDPKNKGTTLIAESKRLNLTIEVFSSEEGMCFQEHYLIIDGELLDNQCIKYHEYYWDKEEYPTIEDYNKAYNNTFTEEQFDEDGYYREGGFESWEFGIIGY